MRENRQIVERWHQGVGSILVSLIRVQGSSYRQPGARLLVSKDGTYEGGISAGCLEADLLRKATWLTRNGAAVEQYSTLFDESADIPFGLGCGGVLDVLLESVGSAECHALLRAIESTLAGCEHFVATWLPKDDRSMMRAVFRSDGKLLFSSADLPNESLIDARTLCFAETGSDESGVFVERLAPPQRLFIFGAGDDARPLATIASLLGWTITVTDGRAHLATKTRFPESNVEALSTLDTAIQTVNSQDAIVIMSHSYEQDRDFLTSVLPARPRYLGLLGSRQRSSLLIAEAAAKLDMSVSECCELICAPVGFDIGGEGPEAIALAIIAEAQACCMGKCSASRKLSAEHVERYLESGDVHRYMNTQCRLDIV